MGETVFALYSFPATRPTERQTWDTDKQKEKEGLAQSVERLTTERNVAGSILGAREILKVLKINWEMKALHAFALQISSG